MVTKVQKWGNSQGIRLTKQLLADADLEVGDAVDVVVSEGAVLVRPVRPVRPVPPAGGLRGRHDLSDLVERIPEDYEPEEVDWGSPVSREAW